MIKERVIKTRPTTQESAQEPEELKPTEDLIDEAFKNYNKKTQEEELIEFVEAQLAKVNKYSAFSSITGEMPTWFEINQSLMNYTHVQTSLIALDVLVKQEAYKAEQDLKDKQAEWYIEAKNLLNPISLAASKWSSSSEIESYVRINHRKELRQLTDIYNAASCKVSVVRRLLDSWSDYKLILQRLSKNIEVDLMTTGVPSIYNSDNK